MDYLTEWSKIELSAADIERVISTHCDMNCDYCGACFKSLPEAQYHYLHEHSISNGHVTCCEVKYKDLSKLKSHIYFHLKPELLKYAGEFFILLVNHFFKCIFHFFLFIFFCSYSVIKVYALLEANVIHRVTESTFKK